MTLQECQNYCEKMVNFFGAQGCFGIIVDELYPGKCWIPDQSLSYLYDGYNHTMNYNGFWSSVTPEIDNCRGGYCTRCNNTYQFKYWYLAEQAGMIFFQIQI